MSDLTRIRVETDSPYDVVVGHGVLRELGTMLTSDVRRVGVIHAQSQEARGLAIRDNLIAAGFEAHAIAVPNGEDAKTSDVAASCWAALGQVGFTRSDAIASVGGGSTTDLAGFVAATFLRGLAVVHLPTTLLAMVDAAVGGKTGINTASGKNLVGSFHEPAGVICDLDSLETLDRAELVSGTAEVIKCGFVADPGILDVVETDPRATLDPTSAAFRNVITRAIAVKASVVARDLKEATSQGSRVGREVLNYGHTLGHAIERAEHYSYRHGEAISVGMVYVAELARLAGRLDREVVDRHRSILSAVGLPTSYAGATWEQLHEAMRVDKKTRGDVLRFVILDDVARPAILEGPDRGLLTAAYAEISSLGSDSSG